MPWALMKEEEEEEEEGRVCSADGAVSTIRTRPTQRLSRPPPIQKLGAENHMLQLNI